jgi:hypothetical protein
MKKLPLLIAVLCLSHVLLAQNTRFGLRGGLNIANQKISVSFMGDKASQSGDAIPSFHIGGMGEIQISDMFFVQPSLLLSGKGMNFSTEDDQGNPIKAKIRPFYLELPINLIIKTQLPNSNLSVYGGAGPSIGYGIFGKVKSGDTDEDAFQDEGFKRFDFGINVTAGVEVPSGWQFSFHFTPGIANIAPSTDGTDADINWKNKVVAFSIGYFLSGNNK